MTTEPPRFLAVWLPDWPVQRARSEQKALSRQPIAFTARNGRAERIVSCSVEARRLGVQNGMRTPDAESLVGPGRLIMLEHEAELDARTLTRLGIACERFSPVVGIEDRSNPEALLLDTRGLATLWGDTRDQGERNLAETINRWLKDSHFFGVTAVASSSSLALAIARYGNSVSQARGASLRIVQDSAPVLDHLPVEALRIDDAVAEKLRSLGVDTVGVLLELPRSALPARFGHELTLRIDQLLGESPEPLIPVRDEPAIEACWIFENSVKNSDVIAATRRKLIEEVTSELARRRSGALRVLLRYEIDSRGQQEIRIPLRLFRPTASAIELQEIAGLHTENHRFPDAVKSIRVLVGSAAPLDFRQQTLFDTHQHGNPHELTRLINRLASQVGYDRVSRVEKRKSVDPHRSYAFLPATDIPSKRFEQTTSQAAKLRRLPLLMTEHGTACEVVVSNSSELPLAVANSKVVRCWGPDRVETGWWRGRGLRRDAYWVEVEDGDRLWLCRNLSNGRWRVLGEFF